MTTTLSSRLAVVPLALAVMTITAPAQLAPGYDRPAADAEFWRTARNCGPNCLYLMLRAHGEQLDYESMLASIDVGPKGTTLPQLRDAAAALGFDTEIQRATPAQLADVELPVIAHMDHYTGDTTRTGHFVLITSYDEEEGVVHTFDGASALYMLNGVERFRESWSGYLLAVRPSPVERLGPLATSVLTGGLVLGMFWWRGRREDAAGARR